MEFLFHFRSTCNAHKNKQLWLNIWVGLCMLGSNPCMNNNIQIGFLTNILTILIFIFHDGLNTKLIIRLTIRLVHKKYIYSCTWLTCFLCKFLNTIYYHCRDFCITKMIIQKHSRCINRDDLQKSALNRSVLPK